MTANFLLTYSVKDNGFDDASKKTSDKVRKDIGSIEGLRHLEALNDVVHRPFTLWEKIDDVETSVKGLVSIISGRDSDIMNDAKKKFSAVFNKILAENKATPKTTIIHCALMIESLNYPFEFTVPEK
ncbi:hypothetical protein ACIPSX_12425 [Pectobacterium sp. CHL-2024]|uniref:hypothetical protein n=1 Tax=Pectobacterium sp. CHL-2024 TaxID=3377079 RepID=UPI00382B9E3E